MEHSLWSVPDRSLTGRTQKGGRLLWLAQNLHVPVSTVSLDLHGAASYQWLMKPRLRILCSIEMMVFAFRLHQLLFLPSSRQTTPEFRASPIPFFLS